MARGSKALKKTDLLKVAEEVERWQPLRNLVGAHFNEWAGALTLVGAQRFAESVLALDSSLTCPRCGRLEGTGIAGVPLACRCGAAVVLAHPH